MIIIDCVWNMKADDITERAVPLVNYMRQVYLAVENLEPLVAYVGLALFTDTKFPIMSKG